MRAVWVDAGNDPDYAKLDANGIGWPYFDAREERLSAAYLDNVRAHPGIDGCGVYVIAEWFPNLPGPQLAEYADHRLRDIAWQGNPPVMFDIEGAHFDLNGYVVPCLQRWRELRPKRITDLTIEGHKGGMFSILQVRQVAKLVRWTVPQCYDGAMRPWDTYAMIADLQLRGFLSQEVRPFMDAAHLLPWWGTPDGFAFTQGRLP